MITKRFKYLLILSLFPFHAVGQEETGVLPSGGGGDDDLVEEDSDNEGGGSSGGSSLNVPVAPVLPNQACSGPRTAGELIDHLLEGYDKYTRPGVAKGLKEGWLSGALLETAPPDEAQVQIHVLALNGIDQKRNEYTLTAWYRRKWKDSRLAYKTISEGGCFPDDASIGFPESIVKSHIWNPDFYIENMSDSPKQTGSAIWISPDGEVLWSSQLEVTLACQMEFAAFPFDTQDCFFKVGTYLENSQNVVLEFFDDREPVTLAKATDPGIVSHGGNLEWEIIETSSEESPPNLGSLTVYSSVIFRLALRRNSAYYTAFVMIPSVMFVIIGWASFFISRSAAPARVAMSMICFLTNTNFLSGQLGQLPRLGNSAWLLKFLATSTYFTFYAVLEYCLCNYLFRIEARIMKARDKARALKMAATDEQEEPSMDESRRRKNGLAPIVVNKQDIIDAGFNRKVDLMILNPKTNRMYFKDEHVDVMSRYMYPTVYLVVFVSLWFTKG